MSINLLAVNANGLPLVARPNSAIPREVTFQLHELRNNQMLSLEDAVTFVRGKLVPDGYAPYPFRKDTPERFLDKLRSVVATYQFRCDVQYWKDQGVDFSLYAYVPEVDPITGDIHHETFSTLEAIFTLPEAVLKTQINARCSHIIILIH